MQMPACLVSSKSGAGVPSELSFITSLHWLKSAVESSKKLYNRTCTMLRIYDTPSLGGTYIVEFQTFTLIQCPGMFVIQVQIYTETALT